MGRLATGIRALGKSSGVEVNALKETPGPQRMRAWKSWESGVLAGITEAFPDLGRGDLYFPAVVTDSLGHRKTYMNPISDIMSTFSYWIWSIEVIRLDV